MTVAVPARDAPVPVHDASVPVHDAPVPVGGAPLLAAIERLAACRCRREAMRLLREAGAAAIGCDGIALLLHEADRFRTALDEGTAAAAMVRETGIARLAMTQRRCLLIQDAGASDMVPAEAAAAAAIRALAVVPLGGAAPAGVLAAFWAAPHPPAAAVERLDMLCRALSGALGVTGLVEAWPHLLFAVRPDGRAVPVGPRWDPYGVPAGGGPIGRDWLRRALHPDERATVPRAWLDAFAEGVPIDLEHRLRHRDGRYRWFRTRAEPIAPAADGAVRWAGSSTEIDRLIEVRQTEGLRREEAERRLAHEVADRAGTEARLAKAERIEAVGQLTSGVAHDFNNLLTVIIGNIEFLEAAIATAPGAGGGAGAGGLLLDPRTGSRLVAMREAAERGGDLTRQLLAFARRQRLEPRPTDLNATVAELRGLLPAAVGGGIEVETVLQPDLWPALVDRTQIERMILNLAMNAHDAVEVGDAILVGTRNRRVGAAEADALGLGGAGDFVEISVTDRGRGMPPQILARAFEPFFTTKPPGKGSGLGLAQVYGFARQSGGIVTLRSAPAEGTCAAILLPRALGAAPVVAMAAIAAPVVAAAASAAVPGDAASAPPMPPGAQPSRPLPAELLPDPGRRPAFAGHGIGARAEPLVLLVDDDVAVREVTSTIVAEAGYRVIEAASGPDALDRLHQNGPVDLMVTDYAMPGMNGFELARAARTRQIGLKVLFVTGYADLTALGDVAETDILLKPFRGAKLIEKILGALRG